MDTPRHLVAVDQFIRSVMNTMYGRGMVNMPFRHGRTRAIERACVQAVAAGKACAVITSRERLAENTSRFVRRTTRDCTTDIDSRSWKSGSGGSLFTCGFGSALCGRSFDAIFVDDLTENAKDALSDYHLQSMWDWASHVISCKINPGGSVVVVGNRWGPKDIFGRLLAEHHMTWDRLVLRALAEADDPLGRKPCEPLWPEQVSQEHLFKLMDAHLKWFDICWQQHDHVLCDQDKIVSVMMAKELSAPVCTCKSLLGQRDPDCPLHKGKP